MTRSWIVLAAAVVASSHLMAQGTVSTPSSRTIFITATDKAGTPVEDLAPTDIDIKEGGKAVVIDDLSIAKNPPQIALIVDDNGTGLFRSALARFVPRVNGLNVSIKRRGVVVRAPDKLPT